MQTFLKPFKKLTGRVLLGLKQLALRARGFKPNKTLLLVFKVRVNYREGGLYVIYSPEDAQRPRAVYHIQPNFEVIN